MMEDLQKLNKEYELELLDEIKRLKEEKEQIRQMYEYRLELSLKDKSKIEELELCLKKILIKEKPDIKGLTWVNWVATDKGGFIHAYKHKPVKLFPEWTSKGSDELTRISPDQAIGLCGRVPIWTDTEPTPVKK
jgi:methionine synthase II (cobalamin-independent)